MKPEQLMYRQSSQLLSYNCIQKGIKYLNFICPILALMSTIIFILLISNEYSRDQYFNKLNKIDLDQETLYILKVLDRKDDIDAKNYSILELKLVQNKELLHIDLEYLIKYHFSVNYIEIDIQEYLSGFNQFLQHFISLETLILIDLSKSQPELDIHIQNINNQQIGRLNNKDRQQFNLSFEKRIFNSTKKILTSVFGFFILHTGIMIFIQFYLLCFPTFQYFGFYLFCFCTNNPPPFEFQNRIYTWVGDYILQLQRNNKNVRDLIMSFLFLYECVYFILAISGEEALYWIINSNFSSSCILVYINIQIIYEGFSLQFFRTRSSLYFLPKIIMLLNLMFILYLKSNRFGYHGWILQMVIYTQFSAIFYFLQKFEIASLQWSNLSPYTPTENRPRALYSPLFNMSWVNDIPQFWSFFTPLCGRRFFNINQLSLVEKNYLLLNQTLNQANEEQMNPVIANGPPQIIVLNQVEEQLQINNQQIE